MPPGRWRPDTHTPVLWDPAAASWQLDTPDQERQLLAKCFLLCSEQHRRVATLAGRQEFGGNVCSQTSQTAPCQQLIHLSSSLDSCFRMPAGDMVSATCYIAKVRSSQSGIDQPTLTQAMQAQVMCSASQSLPPSRTRSWQGSSPSLCLSRSRWAAVTQLLHLCLLGGVVPLGLRMHAASSLSTG